MFKFIGQKVSKLRARLSWEYFCTILKLNLILTFKPAHRPKPEIHRKPLKNQVVEMSDEVLYQKSVRDPHDNLQFGIFEFDEGEFEPVDKQLGFGDLVWSTAFPVHYRIRDCVKRGLGRPLKAYRVHNRTDMYIYHNHNFDYGAKLGCSKNSKYFF